MNQQFEELYKKYDNKDYWNLNDIIEMKKNELIIAQNKGQNKDLTLSDVTEFYQNKNKKEVYNMFLKFEDAIKDKNTEFLQKYIRPTNKFYIHCLEILTGLKFKSYWNVVKYFHNLSEGK